jgi:hypothetical protein
VPTLTPSFQDFLPGWIARQPWYPGSAAPALRPVGFFRLEDPAGAVGMETHLLSDGSLLFQIPVTYRGAPLAQLADSSSGPAALIAEAEHSELGDRWIYDAVRDPVWVDAMIATIATEGTPATRSNASIGPVTGRGVRYRTWPEDVRPVVDLTRILVSGPPEVSGGALGALVGRWHPSGPGQAPVEGCLAVLREPSRE